MNKNNDMSLAMVAYKAKIDAVIRQYSVRIHKKAFLQRGARGRVQTDAFLNVLTGEGKRIRGALVMIGYEMSGGQDEAMILQAALAIEMLHTYLLIIDDIQDYSITRRGQKTTHVALADYHRKNQLTGDPEDFGQSIAINAALSGMHAAQIILADLDVDDQLKLNVLGITNRTMTVTAYGQTGDIFNAADPATTLHDVEQVLEQKTANYTFLNPLHVGMVLAGAVCHETDAITEYAINAGKAFQVKNDIEGLMDDIKEGKRTVLTMYVFEHASKDQKRALELVLGNRNPNSQEVTGTKQLLTDCRVLKYGQKLANEYTEHARVALQKEAYRWDSRYFSILDSLVQSIANKTEVS